MTLSVSAPVRIAAICGLVFTVLVFGGLRLLGSGGSGDSTAAPHVIRPHPFGAGVSKPAQKAAPTKPVAGAAFVPLSVLSQRDVGTLTEQLGVLPDPGVLVYVRPAALAARISGFADKETVAQAARAAGLSS